MITNHSALTKLTKGNELSARIIRWTLKLAESNIIIEHRENSENVVADVLSSCLQSLEEGNDVLLAAKLFEHLQ